ncbi:MAG: hypothetical protein HZC41_25085 [Chloroflexi bacterium]|nr:hypothetical protein [Chloroflexota bacterium]
MSVKDIIAYDTPPPAPMSIFEERVVHPDNQARLSELQNRVERFKPLPFWRMVRMQFRANRLHRKLSQRGVFDLVQMLNAKREELNNIRTSYIATKNEYQQLLQSGAAVPQELIERGQALGRQGKQLREQVRQLEQQLEPHGETYTKYVSLRDRLIEHIDQTKRLKAEEENRKQFFKEGKIVQKALRETFLMTEGCHVVKYTRGGKTKKVAPRFQEVYLSSTVHSFVLLTSKKTLFGWKNTLQVNIEKLIDPKTTLKNASAILHRQVWVDWDRTGSLPIFKINRLDIRDGLPERVLFAGLLEIYPVNEHDHVPLPVGLGENFRAQWMTLEMTPHLLIAGATRSGKSNFVNVIICSLLYMQSPAEMRFIAIDNKEGVEFNRYAHVPHLVDSITDTGDKVLPTLHRAIAVMKRRLRMLKETNAKNILAFNKAVLPEQKMPRLMIFVDEMATLLNREDTAAIHHALTILTAQGAAAGVHVVAATQYPNAETIPMTVKGNMDGIIGFRMPNVHASNMLFNSDDAFRLEKVKGRAYISDAGERYKSQTPYISDAEIDRAIRFAINQYQAKPFAELDALEDTAPVEALPMLEPEPVFCEEDVLAIAFENFDGALKADRIYEVIKPQNVATVSEVRALVKELIQMPVVTFEGAEYRPVKQKGNFWKLIKIESSIERESEGVGVYGR